MVWDFEKPFKPWTAVGTKINWLGSEKNMKLTQFQSELISSLCIKFLTFKASLHRCSQGLGLLDHISSGIAHWTNLPTSKPLPWKTLMPPVNHCHQYISMLYLIKKMLKMLSLQKIIRYIFMESIWLHCNILHF